VPVKPAAVGVLRTPDPSSVSGQDRAYSNKEQGRWQ